ncbi:MAG: hypothetical protein LKI53_05130 [Bacteroidales bacterium]|jgi:hypothetical protein|nr:hypothetical protein [Bacteroidales bacterium]
MKKILSILTVAVLMLSAGAVSAQNDNCHMNGKRQRKKANPEMMARHKANHLQKEFNLSEEQTAKAKAIFMKEFKAMRKAMPRRNEMGVKAGKKNMNSQNMQMQNRKENMKANMAKRHKKMQAIKDQAYSELGNGVLTQEQLEKYKSEVAKHQRNRHMNMSSNKNNKAKKECKSECKEK